jgi:hypothetical protein
MLPWATWYPSDDGLRDLEKPCSTASPTKSGYAISLSMIWGSELLVKRLRSHAADAIPSYPNDNQQHRHGTGFTICVDFRKHHHEARHNDQDGYDSMHLLRLTGIQRVLFACGRSLCYFLTRAFLRRFAEQ